MTAFGWTRGAIVLFVCLVLCGEGRVVRAEAAPACGDSAPQCMGDCQPGQTCIALTRGGTTECVCRNVGCCVKPDTSCVDGATALSCLFANGVWGRGNLCAGGCQTATGDPNGSPCMTAMDCASDNCVDGVCCDTDCNGPTETCTLPGQVGTCATAPAPSPVVSGTGMLLIVAGLMVIGGGALMRSR